jgi:hypothetical protein
VGQDTDLGFLRWLNAQPGGTASAAKWPGHTPNLAWLENQGFVMREPGSDDGYKITPTGRHYQEGD